MKIRTISLKAIVVAIALAGAPIMVPTLKAEVSEDVRQLVKTELNGLVDILKHTLHANLRILDGKTPGKNTPAVKSEIKNSLVSFINLTNKLNTHPENEVTKALKLLVGELFGFQLEWNRVVEPTRMDAVAAINALNGFIDQRMVKVRQATAILDGNLKNDPELYPLLQAVVNSLNEVLALDTAKLGHKNTTAMATALQGKGFSIASIARARNMEIKTASPLKLA